MKFLGLHVAIMGLAVLSHAASLTPQPVVTTKGLESLHFSETGTREWVPNFGTGSPGGEFKCFCDFNGNHYNNPTSGKLEGTTLKQTYAWGTCEVSFTVEADKTLAISGRVTNTSAVDLPNLDLNLCKIGCPVPAPGLPPTINCSFDPGFWYYNGSTAEIPCWFSYSDGGGWPGTFNVGQTNWSANALYARGITLKAGQSVGFKFCLNFVTVPEDLEPIGEKANAAFATTYPQTHWTADLRSVGQVFFVTGSGGSGWFADHEKWKTNPRGWLGDPSINISDKPAFKARMEEFCRTCVANADTVPGIRGFVIWDVEGEQYEHGPCVYVGHPSLMPTLAPEMNEIIDDLLKILEAGGKYQIGFCLRQQQVAKKEGDPNQPYWLRHWDNSDGPEAQEDLRHEINWCVTRWGEVAQLYYVDSNDGNEVDTYKNLRAAYPHFLIYPESFTIVSRMYAYEPNYQTGRPQDYVRNGLATQNRFTAIYPKAQSVINLADVANNPSNIDATAAAMLRGDIQQLRIWWTGGPEYPLLKAATEKASEAGWPNPSSTATPTPQPTITPTPQPTPQPSPSPPARQDTYRKWWDELAKWLLQHPPTPDHP